MDKIEFICKKCSRLLAKTDGNTEIVCPRCGYENKLDIETGNIESKPYKVRKNYEHQISGRRLS